MSNETDLDWLARNVHVWPDGMREVLVCYPRNVDTLIWSCVSSNAGWITKEQWLARRAELQNKPSWAQHPWPQIFQNEDGHWFGARAGWDFKAHISSGLKGDSVSLLRDDGEYLQSGAILGDWRDTLERRPEAMTTTVSQEDIGHLGMKSDHGKPILGAIPPHAELAVGRVLAFGAEKYARGNWDHVADHENRYMDAALRHLNAHRRGELVDGESGESHLAHAACCILFLLDKQERAGGAA